MPNPTPGARLTAIPQHMIDRVAGAVRGLFAGGRTETYAGANNQQIVNDTVRREPWFGPGQPIRPVAPKEDVAGRRFDYPSTYNLGIQPRQYEGVTFPMLRSLADGLDMVRLCIETRKDQVEGVTGKVLPVMGSGENIRKPADDRCAEIQALLRSPDRKGTWLSWQRQLVEQMLVYDAPSIYVRRDLAGRIYSLEVVDGSTIRPLIDETGRQPDPPAPAFQQVLKGVPAVNYTADELIYLPHNPRADRVYGMPPVEQIIMTVNIGLRREVAKLAYYTEGNIPEALISVPKDWPASRISEFQKSWDMLMQDQTIRRRAYFVPGEMNFQKTRADDALSDAYDEWIARIITYCFGLPNLPFVKSQNRATAETAYDQALDEGLQPLMIWLKTVLDRIIQQAFGCPDLEWVWDDVRVVDPAEQETRNLALVEKGIKSVDEMRAEMGLQPLGMRHAIFGIGPMGIMFVDDLLKAQKMGLMMPQVPGINAPMALPPGAGGFAPDDPNGPVIDGEADPADQGAASGAGSTSMHPAAADPLAGVPDSLLAAVGLGAEGRAARTVNVTSRDHFEDDPLRHAAANPLVLKTLRHAESRLGRGA